MELSKAPEPPLGNGSFWGELHTFPGPLVAMAGYLLITCSAATEREGTAARGSGAAPAALPREGIPRPCPCSRSRVGVQAPSASPVLRLERLQAPARPVLGAPPAPLLPARPSLAAPAVPEPPVPWTPQEWGFPFHTEIPPVSSLNPPGTA